MLPQLLSGLGVKEHFGSDSPSQSSPVDGHLRVNQNYAKRSSSFGTLPSGGGHP